jgi:hypothetical protein
LKEVSNLYEETKAYITESILKNELFIKATEEVKTRAVKEAEQQLRNFYGKKVELPIEAIAYQTLWLLRVDDSIQKAEQGVTSISLNGISISTSSPRPIVAPEVFQILGRRVGRFLM